MSDEAENIAEERRAWMGLLARAEPRTLAGAWEATGRAPAYRWLRRPEQGSVMVRGRAGGTGAPFNLGETTVTRCSLALESGEIGHAYVAGRDTRKAEIAALCDALMQVEGEAAGVRAEVLEPLAEAERARRTETAERAAATKVDFFTMVRGEDE